MQTADAEQCTARRTSSSASAGCEQATSVLISLKTEIARSVKGPKLQGLHAEDAMAKPYLVLKNLVT